MLDWLKKVNEKDLKKDPSLQRNQPRKGSIKVNDEFELDGDLSIKEQSAGFEIIKRF